VEEPLSRTLKRSLSLLSALQDRPAHLPGAKHPVAGRSRAAAGSLSQTGAASPASSGELAFQKKSREELCPEA